MNQTPDKWNGTVGDFWRIAWSVPSIADKLAAKYQHFPGHLAFKAYDTHGLPIEVTEEIMRQKGWTVDIVEFERLMDSHRAKSRKSSSFTKQIMARQNT